MAAASFVLASASPAIARGQVHWDVGAQVGAMRRFVSERPDRGDQPGFGPAAQVHAHVAVLPLLRAGAYVGADLSPLSHIPSRRMTYVGGRLKVLPPWVQGASFRTYAFAGAGYAFTYAPSFHRTVLIDGQPTELAIPGVRGNFVEVPLGIGGTYKLRKPFELAAELGARVGFAFSGDAYDSAGVLATNTYRTAAVPGKDTLAVYLAIGVSLDL